MLNLKVCSNFHFIRAIKDGLVIKVENVDSRGMPGLTFKKLDDILGVADSGFPCQPPIDRSTRERVTETTGFCLNGVHDEKNSESDELFGEMTLKQFKIKCRTKKRKSAEPVVLTPKPEPSELEPDDDDLDLKQPLKSLKSSKNPKSKRKHAKKKILAFDKYLRNSEQTTDAEVAFQPHDNLRATITVKVECQEAEYSDCLNMNSVTESPISDQQVGLCGVKSGKNFEVDKGNEPICVVNEVSYDHLDEPIIYLPVYGTEHTEVGHEETVVQQYLVLNAKNPMGEDVNTLPSSLSSVETFSPDKNQSPSMCNSSQTCPDMQQFLPQAESNIEIEVSDATADNNYCMETSDLGDSCMGEDDDMEVSPQNQESRSLSTPINEICSTGESHSCSSPVNEMVSMEDGSPGTIDTVSELSTSDIKDYQCRELQKPPERFLSTRKVISPTSQEKLCLAMKSRESLDDTNLYKCKEKLLVGKQDFEKASLAGSDIKGSIETSLHPKGPEKVIRTKFTINPKQSFKKPKNDKRPSPPRKGSAAPKGCLEGPRLCRSLPNLSTGCTSIQACSESAIAFSQRQMHDIESLALKLMTELKSMKDVVEEKVLYESYRCPSLKNDADEVKAAIKTATKTEETARKWLSLMSRDCTRFCKIMKLTDRDAPSVKLIQENTPPREKTNTNQETTPSREKKISFADEAGGMLCDVKFFTDNLASEESSSVLKQRHSALYIQ